MNLRSAVSLVVLLTTAIASSFVIGCEDKMQAAPGAVPTAEPAAAPPPPKVSPAPSSARATIERVSSQKVCMVNNHFMDAPQIPVTVEGKTYYGCCPMCEKKLRDEPNSRFGIDPISKKRVDKASAVIGKQPSGEVLYFENEQTFNAYQQRT